MHTIRYKNKLKNGETQSFSSVMSTFEDEKGKEKKLLTGIGKKDLRSLSLETQFNYPKPVIVMKKIISQIHSSAIVLDFFAGSGTIGQAVLELNKEDGGNRKDIY